MGWTSVPRVIARVRRGEVGAGSAVYAGVIVVVVILVGALAVGMTPVGQDLATGVRNEICKIFNESCAGSEEADGGDKPPAVDPRRPGECVVSSHKDSQSSYAKILFVKISPDLSFLTQREQYYDPKTGEVRTRYRVVASKGLGAGAETGVGTKGEIGDTHIGADLSAGISSSVKGGDTWEFDSEEEMNAFIQQYQEYGAHMSRAAYDPMYAEYAQISGNHPALPRGADKTSTTFETEGHANGDVGLRFGHDNEDLGEEAFNPNAGVFAKATASTTYTRTEDHRSGHEGEYSLTYGYEGSIGGGLNAVFAGVGGNGKYNGTITYSFKPGPDGQPRLSSVTFNQVTAGELEWNLGSIPGSKVGAGNVTGGGEGTDKHTHVTKTTIEVTDANRSVVEGWAAANMTAAGTGAEMLLLPSNILDPSVPAPGDPMGQVLYEGATSSHTVYHVDSNTFSLGGEVALGLKLGAGFSFSNEDQNVVSSTYLESPTGPGAPRLRRNNDVCDGQSTGNTGGGASGGSW